MVRYYTVKATKLDLSIQINVRNYRRLSRPLVQDADSQLEASASLPTGGKSNFYYYDVVDEHRVALEQGGSVVGAGYYEQGSNSAKFAQLLEIR